MAQDNKLETLPHATELGKIYQPILKDIAALNTYLHDEFESTEPFVHELLVHIAQYRGKQIRPAALFLAARTVGGQPQGAPVGQDLIKCAAVLELIHTATLVHDDVLDEASVRRRVDTVNKCWGERASVLLGDFIYSRGFSISCEVPGVAKMLADITHTICEGELLQVGSAFDVNLSEERYYEIIRKKTAVLYGLAGRLGAMLGGGTEEEQQLFEDFGIALGMAFQIADDALDLMGEEHVVGKSLGSDLRKGKLTLPIIRLRDKVTKQRQELIWLLEHPAELGTQVRVSNMLKQNEVLPEVEAIAASFVQDALTMLDRFEPGPSRQALELLGQFILAREL